MIAHERPDALIDINSFSTRGEYYLQPSAVLHARALITVADEQDLRRRTRANTFGG
jgi:hypothetical protein